MVPELARRAAVIALVYVALTADDFNARSIESLTTMPASAGRNHGNSRCIAVIFERGSAGAASESSDPANP